RERRGAVEGNSGDGKLDGKLGPVAAERLNLNAAAEGGPRAVVQVALQPSLMTLEEARGDEELGHVPSHRGVTAEPEHLLCRRVELRDRSPVVDADDGVQGRVQDGALARLAPPKRLLCRLALSDVLHERHGIKRSSPGILDPGGTGVPPGDRAVLSQVTLLNLHHPQRSRTSLL